jgi:hypothetical protein
MLGIAQQILRANLFFNNRVHIRDGALDVLRNLPPGAGVILASNHADETDPSVYMEFARQSGKSFSTMCNREAFDEMFGLAGFLLQRFGYFSIERGVHDTAALNYAVDVVKQNKDFLLLFPEGEIFYMNEEVQPFHQGAAEIGMQAVVANRKIDPNWTAYIVPMAIKYHYPKPIDDALEARISKMEAQLLLKGTGGSSYLQRLFAIYQTLLRRQKVKHQIITEETNNQGMTQEVKSIQRAMLSQIEEKHPTAPVSKKQTLDRSWQLAAELRDGVEPPKAAEKKKDLHRDLEQLRVIAQLTSWRPHYHTESNSQDRLAEAVMKLERGLYNTERPRQLAHRDVYIDVTSPIDLGPMASEYINDPHPVRQRLTNQCQEQVQLLLDKLSKF